MCTLTGYSAGGNLAAAVAIRLRNIGQVPRPSIQVLIVPCLQAVNFKTPSYQNSANVAPLSRYFMTKLWLWYALGAEGHQISNSLVNNNHTSPAAKASAVFQRVDHSLIAQKYIDASFVPDTVDHGNETLWKHLEPIFLDPYFAPLMAANLKDLPAAYVVTAEHDVLRDDGIMYVRRLSNEGVATTHRHYEGGCHTLLGDFTKFNLSNVVLSDLVKFLAMRL
jgi:neutral cholesterol ester hydrolase 1